MTKTTSKINSVREALEYVDADFESNKEGEIIGVRVRCRGCSERVYFQAIYTFTNLYDFASKHAICTEIKRTLPQVPAEDDVFEPEGRFNSGEPKRLY